MKISSSFYGNDIAKRKDWTRKMAMHAALERLAYKSLKHDTLYFRESQLKEDEIQWY